MIRVCSYCGKVFGEKEPLENKEETHGICPECFPEVMKNFEKEMEEIKREETGG